MQWVKGAATRLRARWSGRAAGAVVCGVGGRGSAVLPRLPWPAAVRDVLLSL